MIPASPAVSPLDHVGSFLRPKYLLEAREQNAEGRDQRRAAARGRRQGDRRDRQVPGGRRPEEHHRRRVPPHLLPHRLPRAARRREDRHPGHDQEARRHRGAGAAGDARDRQGAPREGHPARRLRVPEEPGVGRQHAEGHDPVADDAALPRRPRRHQQRAYPELDPTFYDDVATAYGDELRSLAAAGCTYVQMDDTNLAYLCDEKMREAARQRGDDPNELPHRYAGFINKVVAQKPAGMTLAMHLCRGNFKSTHAAARQLRAGGRGAAHRDGPRRLLPRVRRRALAATSGRCASCPRARPSCSAW